MTGPRGSTLRRVVGNSLWLIGAEACTRALSFATILYLTRTLALSGMGVVEFGMAVFNVVQVLTISGIDVLAMRAAARRPADLPRLAGWSVLVAWTQFLVVFALLGLVALALPYPPELRWAAVLFALAAAAVPPGMRFALVARERMRVLGIATPLAQAVFLALCVLIVRRPEHVLRVPLAWIVAVGLRSGIQLATFVREHGALRLTVRRRVLVRWLRAALGVGAGSAARRLMVMIDVLVLGLLVAPEWLAPYGVASKLPLFLVSLAALVHIALFPTVARTVVAGERGRLAAIQGDTLKALLGVAIPGALCLSLVAEPLVVLLFTTKFQAAVPLFRVLVWRFPLAAASGVFRTTLWARSPAADARVALELLAATVAALVVGVAVAGPAGAAAAMLLGEVVALGLYLWHAEPRRLLLAEGGWLVRLAIAAGIVIALGSVAVPTSGLAAVAGAVGTWAVASLVVDFPYVRRMWTEVGRGAETSVLPG